MSGQKYIGKGKKFSKVKVRIYMYADTNLQDAVVYPPSSKHEVARGVKGAEPEREGEVASDGVVEEILGVTFPLE